MLAGEYTMAPYGGSTSAIPRQFPEKPLSVVTTLDGHQWPRCKGRLLASRWELQLLCHSARELLQFLLIVAWGRHCPVWRYYFGPAEYFL